MSSNMGEWTRIISQFEYKILKAWTIVILPITVASFEQKKSSKVFLSIFSGVALPTGMSESTTIDEYFRYVSRPHSNP